MKSERASEWRPCRLQELGFVGRGKSRHRPRNDPQLYDGEYPFFQTGDIRETNFYLKKFAQTYNEMGLLQSKLWQPGTLCITIAANIAETAILAIPGCFPDSVVGFIADDEKTDVRFIKYYIDSELKSQMQNISRGTTQDNLSLDKLLSFDIHTPTLKTQQKIAAILSSYDDLIENNTRRIEILEDMARGLYREWFVNFRFPGHEEVEMVDGLPVGWIADVIGKASSYINRGVTPKYREDAEGVVINQKCIRNQRLSLEPARKHESKVPADKFVRFGDVLVNSTGVGTLGRVAQVYEVLENCTVDTHVTIVRPGLDVDNDYFGLSLLELENHFEAQAIGATGQTELGRERVAQTPFLRPPSDLQKVFGERVQPMRKLAFSLQRKNANLRRTRDLLLPKLISGEIDVSTLEVAGVTGSETAIESV